MLNAFKKAGIKNPNNKDFQFWQQNNHPIELSDRFIMKQKLDYVHNNPVIEGIVEEPYEYVYSSAKNYAGMKGLIDVILLE